MASVIVLKKDSVEIEIAGPVYRDQPVAGPTRWVTGLTSDGTRYAYQLNSSDWRTWRMNLELTEEEFEDLEHFFYNVAQGPTHTFTFTSTSEKQYTARFAEPNLDASRLGPKQWFVTLTIEVSGPVVESEGSE